MSVAVGDRFGSLVVVGESDRGGERRSQRWVACRCDCGCFTATPVATLLRGRRLCCKLCAQRERATIRAEALLTPYALTRSEQQWCHRVYKKALRSGALVPAERCERCGEVAKTGGHHEDYSKPLEVTWLCGPCHGKRHGELHTATVATVQGERLMAAWREDRAAGRPLRDAMSVIGAPARTGTDD